MAIALFHFHVTQIKRSAGQSAVAAAAYRSGEKLHSEYYGEDSDYTRKGGVICSEILLPPQAPPSFSDRETLWNAVEKVERGKRAQLAYSFDIALQNEFSIQENIELARHFLLEQCVSRGMVADYAIHQPDKKDGGIQNPHFHVMCPIRPIEPDGKWGNKQRREYVLDEQGERIRDEAGNYVFNAVPTTDWGKPETLEFWREQWAQLCNTRFAEKGLDCRIDHRSYERQGIEQIPTRQMCIRDSGYSASAVGVIYNTTVVPELNADWSELADAQYKDMITIPDPEKSGACKEFLAGLVTGTETGKVIMQNWADNGLTVPGANKAALEAVTTGEKGILIAGVDYNAYSSIAKGEPLNIYYPASGTVVNPRPAMILKTAPNMDNAKAFVDFLFSDEAQKLVADAYLLPGRSDVQCENRTNLSDIPQIPTDWDKMMSVASDTAAKLNSLCK